MLVAPPLLVCQLVRQSPFRQISGAENDAPVVALLLTNRSPAPNSEPSVATGLVVPTLNQPVVEALPMNVESPKTVSVVVGLVKPIPTLPSKRAEVAPA